MEDLRKYNPEGSTLRKAQMRMLEILKVFDAICAKHGIEYTLDGGTLLGAVRHGGFIPWDDDLDVNVMREDLFKLRKILPKELPSNYVYQDYTTERYYPNLFGKIRDRNSYIHEDASSERFQERGIFIDIIPIEEIPNLKWKAKLDYWYGHSFRGIHHHKDMKDTILSWIVIPFAWPLVVLTRFINKFRNIDQLAHIYGWGAYGGFRKKDYYPIRRMDFEGFQACVPNNPDAVLTALFGDYMKIPSEDKRIVHSTKIEFYNEPHNNADNE